MGNQFNLYLAEANSEPCEEALIKLVQSLTIFAKSFILDVSQGSEYPSVQEIIKMNKPNKVKKTNI